MGEAGSWEALEGKGFGLVREKAIRQFAAGGWWHGLIAFSMSLIVQLVKNLPAMQETLVRFLGREDPLEKG